MLTQADLNEWLEASSKGWSSNARVIAKSWLKAGLQPRLVFYCGSNSKPILPDAKMAASAMQFAQPKSRVKVDTIYTVFQKIARKVHLNSAPLVGLDVRDLVTKLQVMWKNISNDPVLARHTAPEGDVGLI